MATIEPKSDSRAVPGVSPHKAKFTCTQCGRNLTFSGQKDGLNYSNECECGATATIGLHWRSEYIVRAHGPVRVEEIDPEEGSA